MLIDNTHLLKDIMVFNEKTSYYKFVALIRAKDYDENNQPLLNKEKKEIIVKQWLIDSQESLDKALPDMFTFIRMFKCRLYMTIDRKSVIKTMMNIRDKMIECIDQSVFNHYAPHSVKMLDKVVSSMTSCSESSDKERRWMFDVDTKDETILQKVVKACGEHYMATFETKNGYHVIAHRMFDACKAIKEINEHDVEFKDNSLVLVAMDN